MKAFWVIVLSALWLTGCASMGAESSNLASSMQHQWKLVQIDGTAVPSGVTSTLGIGSDWEIHGKAGCNRFFGPATLKDGQFKAGVLGSTMMACPKPAMQVEKVVLGTLGNGAKVSLKSGQMVLAGSEHTLTYVRKAESAH